MYSFERKRLDFIVHIKTHSPQVQVSLCIRKCTYKAKITAQWTIGFSSEVFFFFFFFVLLPMCSVNDQIKMHGCAFLCRTCCAQRDLLHPAIRASLCNSIFGFPGCIPVVLWTVWRQGHNHLLCCFVERLHGYDVWKQAWPFTHMHSQVSEI